MDHTQALNQPDILGNGPVAGIATALARGVRKVSAALKVLRLDFVFQRDWRRIEPSERILKNMNAPGDYKEALKWSAKRLKERLHVKKPRPAPKRKRRIVPRRRK
jgi:hypothetical protein